MENLQYHRRLEQISPTRQRVMGVVFLIIAGAIWLFFGKDTLSEQVTSFGLVAGSSTQALSPWEIPTKTVLFLLAIAAAMLGGIQLSRGFKKWTNLVLGLVVGFFIFSFLVWAAAGKSLNLAGLLATTLNKSVPITLGALAGILSERAGVLNLGIEGMMLMGAISSAFISSVTQNMWLGLISAIILGGLTGLLHGIISIRYKINQIISGTAINIFATGITSYLSSKFLQTYQYLNDPGTFKPVSIPALADIPFIGPILFNNNLYVYAMFFLLILLHFALFYTIWGLRVRSVGEHPRAADTLGIQVIRLRYMGVILSGMMAGFAGSYFVLGSVGRFDEMMTAGRGFIGLAAMIFGNWLPFGSFAAGLIFGFADSIATRLAILQINIPSQFMLMIPYAATMIVLAGVIGRSQPPAADGVPYEKE